MPETSIERAAKAIIADFLRQYDKNFSWEEAKDVVEDFDPEKLARAAIASLAEPSEAMIKAGREEYDNLKDDEHPDVARIIVVRIFRAMIAAALAEGNGT